MHAIAGAREANALAPGAILPKMVHVKPLADPEHIRIAEPALIPTPARSKAKYRLRLLAPSRAIHGPRQTDARRVLRAGLIPIPECTVGQQSRAVGCNVIALPGRGTG